MYAMKPVSKHRKYADVSCQLQSPTALSPVIL